MRKRKIDNNLSTLNQKTEEVRKMRYLSNLSDQLKTSMYQENINKNKSIVSKVRQSEELTRESLDNFRNQQIRKSQINYLDKLTSETFKIERNKKELKSLENIESHLLQKIKNTQNI